MASKDPILDRLMMVAIAVGVVIAVLAAYAIATEPEVIVQVEGADRPTDVEVVMTEFAFAPARFDVEPGETYEFEVHNEGAIEHEFRLTTQSSVAGHIEGGHADHDDAIASQDRLVLVAAGESATMTVTFDGAATFDLVACLLPGHYESGMHAPLGGLAQSAAGEPDSHDDEVPHDEDATDQDDESTEHLPDAIHNEDGAGHAEEPADDHGADVVADDAASDAETSSGTHDQDGGNEDADEADVAPEEADDGHDDDGHTH